MSYSNNPLLPKARAAAVRLVVVEGLPLTIAARKSGIHRSTLWRWKQRWLALNQHVQFSNTNRPRRVAGTQFRFTACRWLIPTLSSKPQTSPRALSQVVIDRIVYWRNHKGRCAGVVHAHCLREGVQVSLSSVKRTLRRLGLLVKPRYYRYRPPIVRPVVAAPGDLVQTDTVHLVHPWTKQRVYLYTLINLYSRYAYVEYHEQINQRVSLGFLKRGQQRAGFQFACVQSDNGGEFGRWLNDQLKAKGTTLRHSRVRKPNDNAHIERFNRTIQQEGLHYHFPQSTTIQRELQNFLAYYNTERLHSSLQYRTPQEMLQRS